MPVMTELWAHIGISPVGVLGVVIASTLLYIAYAAVLAVWGPRLFSSTSTLSLSLLTLLGALFARAMLGHSPTLTGGLIATGTLLILEGMLGRLRSAATPRWRSTRPTVVMVEGQIVRPALRKRRLSENDLHTRLRLSGIRRRRDVALVILEPRGSLTVLTTGQYIERALLRGVVGASTIPAHLVCD